MNPKSMTVDSVLRAGLLRGPALALLLAAPFVAHGADFALKDLQGKSQRLADYRGKWVLVNFWGTWCPPCLHEIPELVSLHKAHKDKDLVVIGIAVDSGSAKTVTDFAKSHGVIYPMVMEDDQSRRQLGEMDVLPTSYLYDPTGDLVSYQQGEVTRESVEAYIRNKAGNKK